MRSAIFIVVIATALVSSSVVVKAASEEQPNLSKVIQDTTVESVAKHMNNNLRGLSTYEESDTTNDEERTFVLDKVASALHIGKEAKALKLFRKKASLQKFIDKGISPEVLFKAIGLNHLGTDGKMTYAQFKALSGEEKARVARMVNSDEELLSKTNMVSHLAWAWRNKP